jgi:hypothetical protein
MFDNSMTGAVGFAMHADRLARATRNLRLQEVEEVMAFARDEDRARAVTRNLRLIEAEQARAGRRAHVRGSVRVLIAQALVALATRIAPSVITGMAATAR